MEGFLSSIVSSDFLKLALPATGAIVAWFWNERRKVRWEQLQRKEERYKELLRCLKGFYTNNQDPQLKREFIDQVGLCWLYAPDEVIQRANDFFASIHRQRQKPATDEEKERALGELILAIRRDMLSRTLVTSTTLKATDWKNFNA